MSTDNLAEAKLAEYQQQRRAELLRQQLYAQPDPSQSPELSQALAEAEEELRKREEARRALEQAEGHGILLETTREGRKPSGVIMGADTTGIDAQVLLRMAHVPTGIAHLLNADRMPLVTFNVRYTGRKFVRLRLTSFVEEYSAQAVTTVELQYSDEPQSINQLPTFFPDRLEHVNELTRATLHIVIDDLDRKTEQESTFPVWLLARTSAYNGVEDPATGAWVDLSPYYGAWVTPNVPEVMQLLRRAADLHPERAIVGYQVDPQGIEEQVRAIFNALKAEEIIYINSVLSFGATKGEYMQRVRLPRESLALKSANCIDGTVLMASVLEAASLNPALVLVPGHAFLAWETQDGSREWEYLETTMIATRSFEAAHESGRAQAGYWEERLEQTQDPYFFRLLSLPHLRSRLGITPME